MIRSRNHSIQLYRSRIVNFHILPIRKVKSRTILNNSRTNTKDRLTRVRSTLKQVCILIQKPTMPSCWKKTQTIPSRTRRQPIQIIIRIKMRREPIAERYQHQWIRLAIALEWTNAGNKMAAKIPITVITNSNSVSVKPRSFTENRLNYSTVRSTE